MTRYSILGFCSYCGRTHPASVVVFPLKSHPYGRWSPNSLKSYLFERRAVMNFAILRSEAGPLKNFAVLLSYETVGNFAGHRGPPILADVVKVIAQFTRAYNVDSMRRHFDPFSHVR